MLNRPATPAIRQSTPKRGQRRFLTRRIWLPGAIYAALPLLYLLLGAIALISGIYLPDPGWILGYLLLISAGCLHAGLWLILLRRRHRCYQLRQARAQRPQLPCHHNQSRVMTDRT